MTQLFNDRYFTCSGAWTHSYETLVHEAALLTFNVGGGGGGWWNAIIHNILDHPKNQISDTAENKSNIRYHTP